MTHYNHDIPIEKISVSYETNKESHWTEIRVISFRSSMACIWIQISGVQIQKKKYSENLFYNSED